MSCEPCSGRFRETGTRLQKAAAAGYGGAGLASGGVPDECRPLLTPMLHPPLPPPGPSRSTTELRRIRQRENLKPQTPESHFLQQNLNLERQRDRAPAETGGGVCGHFPPPPGRNGRAAFPTSNAAGGRRKPAFLS